MEELTGIIQPYLEQHGVVAVDTDPDKRAPFRADLVVSVPTADGARRVFVEVKDRQPLGPAEALQWAQRRGPDVILAMPHITADQGRRYRQAHINFVDSGGNMHLEFPGLYVHVEGRRPTVTGTGQRTRPATRTKTGLRVLFALLVRPGLADATYDVIADLAGVSKGSVAGTMADLRKRGHLTDTTARQLVDVQTLVREWTDAYTQDLLPRLRHESVAGPAPQWWIDAPEHEGWWLSGGPALRHYGAPLRPATSVVYGDPPWAQIRRQARLTRFEEPTVVLRERFWSPALTKGQRFVPPLLAYADGLASEDPRERETAAGLWPQGEGLFADA